MFISICDHLTVGLRFNYNHMVMQRRKRNTALAGSPLDLTFAALGDPTRRAILALLAAGDASVTELARPFAISQPAISKHLKVLEHAGLITRVRDAQRRPSRIRVRPLERASEWLAAYRSLWEEAERAPVPPRSRRRRRGARASARRGRAAS